MKNKFTIPFLTFSAIFIFLLFNFTKSKKISIEGNWRIVEVKTIKPDGTYSKVFPKESQVIFLRKYYSFCWTTQVSKNRNWAMTDSLKLDRFNQSIVNTGTFELKDSILTTKAEFAMNPMFTNGIAKFKCSTKADTLILKGLNVISSDNIQHPVYKNGAYFVTKLVKIKD
jgi:hypothetical protein